MKKKSTIKPITYTLSKEQFGKYILQKAELIWAEQIRDTVKKQRKHYENLIQCCSNCNAARKRNSLSNSAFAEVQSGHTKQTDCICAYCGGIVEKKILDFDHIRPANVYRLIKHLSDPKKRKVKDRIIELSREIQLLIFAKRKRLKIRDAQKLRKLFTELQSLMNLVVARNQHVYRLFAKKKYRITSKDLRAHTRNRSLFLHSHIPDFSGCEEEAGLTEFSGKPFHSHLNNRKVCSIIQNPYLPRLIPLSNLRMTG